MSLRGAILAGVVAGLLAVAGAAPASGQQPSSDAPVRPVVAPQEELKNLTLVKSDTGKAVVRFGAGDLVLLSVGDRVGRTAAVVRSVEAGRLVLDEVAPGADGAPQRSQIVWRDGETGGTRFRRQPGERAPVGARPRTADPASTTKPAAPKKPGAGR